MNRELIGLHAEILTALAHPLRLKILEKLRSGACCVCKIIPYVGGEQSNVSHHLAILRKAGIVHSEKKGLEVWYEVTDEKVYRILDLLTEYIVRDLTKAQKMLRAMEKIET